MYWQGVLDEAVPRMEKGVQMFRDISAELTLPAQLCVLAKGYLKTGRLAESRLALEEGMGYCEKNDDRTHEAELQRLEGELVLAELGDRALAEQCFRKAIETARRQKSRAWELRATVSLAGLLKEKGDREEARTMLATIYGEYKDGFDAPDLISASELLKTLA
jgi:tetratricopeptide (TPR) repeat protein